MTLAEDLRRRLERAHALDVDIFETDLRGAKTGLDEAVDAAVLIPVVAHAEPTVILTRRTDELPSHPGQVAFPGGKVDPGDDGPIGAALREAEEEIALPRRHVELVGTTDLYLTGTGYHVTPVIGVVPPGLPLRPEEGEVAAIFEVPFATLFDPASYAEREIEWQGRMRRYFEMHWDDHRIWGVTAAIIMNLARRLEAVSKSSPSNAWGGGPAKPVEGQSAKPSSKAASVRKGRELRKQMSLPEVLLWRELRKRPAGLKFRRQRPEGQYVLDFYCHAAKLAVEVDGEAHERGDRPERDARRDLQLRKKGIRTLRIAAREILKDPAAAAEHIAATATSRLPLHRSSSGPPPPTSCGEDL